MDSRISSAKIAVNGYFVTRKDRDDTKRGRGGGVVILTKNVPSAEVKVSVKGVCGIRLDTTYLFLQTLFQKNEKR